MNPAHHTWDQQILSPTNNNKLCYLIHYVIGLRVRKPQSGTQCSKQDPVCTEPNCNDNYEMSEMIFAVNKQFKQ